MRVTTIPIGDPQWCDFTSSHPLATPFHLPAWTSVIADCYHFDAFVLAIRDRDREILAGAPTVAVRSPFGRLRWVSLPFSDSCPLLVRADAAADEVVGALSEYVLAGPARELEVRAELPEAERLYRVEVGYDHVLELPRDPADLHPNKGHRNSRNRAIRKGVQVTRGNGAHDVATFYRLHALTRRRHGVPVQPRRFFDLIQDRLLAHGHGFVATATLDGEVLASGLYLHHNGTLAAKFYASDPGRPDVGAGYLIEWETMVAACVEGYHTLDMGRTDFGADGLRLYKSSWGTVERPLVYTHISRTPLIEQRPSVGDLPARIIRRSPVWVCRALGEVLYRWSA
jgi:CelD/BcsL family acetyltransferase involved in cellulose biosynthesis